MIIRQNPEGFYAYPSHRPWWSRMLWHLGFDPLLAHQRIRQMRVEIKDWQRWLAQAQQEVSRGRAAMSDCPDYEMDKS